MKIVTAGEMQQIDTKTIREYGIPGVVLMERAGLSVVETIKERFGNKRIVVISGVGNNGGDGMVIARNLHNQRWPVTIFLVADPERLKGDAAIQYSAAMNFGLSVSPIQNLLDAPEKFLTKHTLVIDAMLGTGLSKEITGKLSEVITCINHSEVPVLAVDIPTGISSDSGQVLGNAVKADCTVTFGLPKYGHILYPGAEHTGKLLVSDIGFPRELLTSDKIKTELLERNFIASLIPTRNKYSHKGSYGHVLVVAGSRGKTGAAILSAEACLRSGAGLVTIGVPETLADVFQSRVTEAMLLILPDRGDGTIARKSEDVILDFLAEKADLLAIGPGIGVSPDTEKIVKALIKGSGKPVVIDADGINVLQGNTDVLKQAKSTLVLTPHPGEMGRLLVTGKRKERIPSGQSIRGKKELTERDRINTAIAFARETGTFLVLKGVPTIIATPDGYGYINTTGSSALATAGTGDVLTGMISGFYSQTSEPRDACILGVFLHGLAADSISEDSPEHSVIASDIIKKIPATLRALYP